MELISHVILTISLILFIWRYKKGRIGMLKDANKDLENMVNIRRDMYLQEREKRSMVEFDLCKRITYLENNK